MDKWTRSKGMFGAVIVVTLATVVAFISWSLARNRRVERVEGIAAQFDESLKPDPNTPENRTCRTLAWRFAKCHWFDVGNPIIPDIVEKYRQAGCDPAVLDTIRQTHARLREAE